MRSACPTPTTFLPTLAATGDWMDTVAAAHGVESHRVVVAGFSQGAVMSYALGLGAGRPRPAGVIALSGFVPTVPGFELDLAGRTELPVAIGHGTLDQVIEVEWGRRARDLLEGAGMTVRYRESVMGHSIDPEFLDELSRLAGRGRSRPLISLLAQLPQRGATMRNQSTGGLALLSGAELASWRGFLRVHAALERELDAELAERHGLPLSSYEVLLTVADAPGERMRMSEIADSVLLSRSGVTRLVDRLERDGLVERIPCEDDARGQYAVLTSRGREAFDAARVTPSRRRAPAVPGAVRRR